MYIYIYMYIYISTNIVYIMDFASHAGENWLCFIIFEDGHYFAYICFWGQIKIQMYLLSCNENGDFP